jgi:hypothetical protein
MVPWMVWSIHVWVLEYHGTIWYHGTILWYITHVYHTKQKRYTCTYHGTRVRMPYHGRVRTRPMVLEYHWYVMMSQLSDRKRAHIENYVSRCVPMVCMYVHVYHGTYVRTDVRTRARTRVRTYNSTHTYRTYLRTDYTSTYLVRTYERIMLCQNFRTYVWIHVRNWYTCTYHGTIGT